jgi:hypothetical protein
MMNSDIYTLSHVIQAEQRREAEAIRLAKRLRVKATEPADGSVSHEAVYPGL